MPESAQKGPRAPESKPRGSSGPRGPRAFKGPMPPAGVLADAKSLPAEVVKTPDSPQDQVTVVDLSRPTVDSAPSTPSVDPSPAPTTPDTGVWEDWPQIRTDPTDPLLQAVLVRNTRTGEFRERLVGPGVPAGYPLLPVGSPLRVDVSSPPSVAAAAAAPTTPTNTTHQDLLDRA
jgi:hypothetical protein